MDGPSPAGLLTRVYEYVLVVVLAVLLALWGAFLVPLRVHGLPVPLSPVIAVLGNVGLGYAGGQITGRRWGALVPPVLWLIIVFTLARQRQEGDLVLPNTVTALAFLGLGAVAGGSCCCSGLPQDPGQHGDSRDPSDCLCRGSRAAHGRDRPAAAGSPVRSRRGRVRPNDLASVDPPDEPLPSRRPTTP